MLPTPLHLPILNKLQITEMAWIPNSQPILTSVIFLLSFMGQFDTGDPCCITCPNCNKQILLGREGIGEVEPVQGGTYDIRNEQKKGLKFVHVTNIWCGTESHTAEGFIGFLDSKILGKLQLDRAESDYYLKLMETACKGRLLKAKAVFNTFLRGEDERHTFLHGTLWEVTTVVFTEEKNAIGIKAQVKILALAGSSG